MARNAERFKAVAEGLAEWQETVAETEEFLNGDCRCCCCTGECTYTYADLEEIEVQVYYGELDRYPF